MAAPEEGAEAARAHSLNRVKVYQLNQDGAWEDQGTGYAAILNKYIVVHAEEDEKPSTKIILEAPILPESGTEDVYQRQGDTIISWNDPSLQADLALSFQEAKLCAQFWADVMAIHGRSQGGQISGPFANDAQMEAHPMTSQHQQLPEPSMENLPELANIIENCGMYQREHLAQAFVKPEYLRQLVEHFAMCEDLENEAGLEALFKIFKGMVMLNDQCLIEKLLSEEYILTVCGVLEYDPDLNSRTNHREYLTKTAVFKEVIPIHDKSVLAHTHQNFRVNYLKDVILAKYLDDHTFSTLTTMVYFNNVDIVDRLQSDSAFMDNLFSALLDNNNSEERLSDLVGFLQEFCNLAPNLQQMPRSMLYKKLLDRNLFKVMEICLSHPKRSLRLSVVDIASGFIKQDSHLWRAQMMQESPKCKILGQFVDQLFADNDAGMKSQIKEMIQHLLDPELMEGTSEKDDFLNLFYESFMEPLVSCISAEQVVLDKMRDFRRGDKSGKCAKEQIDSDQTLVLTTQNQVCELLGFCVQNHGYRIKYFILRHNIVQKALQLVLKKEVRNGMTTVKRPANNFLTLTVMRFVRACVSLKDEFYNRHLVKNNLFESIMIAFQQNGKRYNLFNSAVIDLVDFCRRENVKSLVAHLVEVHRDKFAGVEYVSTFTDLVKKHEQNTDLDRPISTMAEETQQQQPWRRKAESDDESYFNESDSGDEAAPALSASDMDVGPMPSPRYQVAGQLPDNHGVEGKLAGAPEGDVGLCQPAQGRGQPGVTPTEFDPVEDNLASSIGLGSKSPLKHLASSQGIGSKDVPSHINKKARTLPDAS